MMVAVSGLLCLDPGGFLLNSVVTGRGGEDRDEMRLLLTMISLTDGSLGQQILLITSTAHSLPLFTNMTRAASPCQVILQRSENMNQFMTRRARGDETI